MRVTYLSRSLLHFWEQATFLEAALLASDETKDLAAPVTEVLDDFQAVLQRDLSSRRTILQANARGSIADANIDTGIRQLFSGVLHLVGQDRKRSEFISLFPSHIGQIVRHALRRQIEVADQLLRKLSTLPLFPESFRTQHQTVLEPLIATGRAVVEEQKQAEVARVATRLDTTAWKDEVNALMLAIYSQLLAIAATTGRKKAWAEAFFPRASKRSTSGDLDIDADDDDTDEPTDI